MYPRQVEQLGSNPFIYGLAIFYWVFFALQLMLTEPDFALGL
jgi:hypothetical protein